MQQLLNTIPETLLARLTEDGLFGRKTLLRVIEFQKNAKLFADGVVGPQSWAMLDDLTKLLLPAGTTIGALGAWRNEPFREDVLKVALAEALPVSNVSDMIALKPDPSVIDPLPTGKPPTKTPQSWRFGWKRLKQYFDEAFLGYIPGTWSMTHEIKIDGTIEVITNLNGVRGNNWRIPNPGDTVNKGGIHWCGVFGHLVLDSGRRAHEMAGGRPAARDH